MEDFAEITVNELGIKSCSKKEVYNLLWNEEGIYLPPIKDTNHKFISQLLVGEKKYLKWWNVKVCTIPHYDSLRIPDLLKFTRTKIDIDSYLWDYEYSKHPNKLCLYNVLNTLLGSVLRKYIDLNTEKKVKYIIKKKKLTVKTLPEFIAIFKNSKNVSIGKGKTNHLIKRFGKRKWHEIEDDNKEKLKEAHENFELLQSKIHHLEQKISEYDNNQNALLEDRGKLWKLYEVGCIDSDGEIKET